MTQLTDIAGKSIQALMDEKDMLRLEAEALVEEALEKQRVFLEDLKRISMKQQANILKMSAADDAIRQIAGMFYAEA